MTRLGPSRRMRDRFDFDAWLMALHRAVQVRGVTWKDLSAATGVSEATLSRMRLHARHPDAASLAALSAWAGLNPAKYVKEP